MVYHKLLKLGSASDQILGKVVNICINDMERVLEAFRVSAFVTCEWCDLLQSYGCTLGRFNLPELDFFQVFGLMPYLGT